MKQILVQRDATIPITAKTSVVTENPISDPNPDHTENEFLEELNRNSMKKIRKRNDTALPLSSVIRRRISDLKLLSC